MSEALAYVAQQGLREIDLRRFYAKIDRDGGPDACHPWTGYRMAGGYGLWTVLARDDFPTRTYRAHRLALILAVGPIGDLFALHGCDFPPCCNESHLRAGTAKDNMDDVVRRGRHWTQSRPETIPRGRDHWTSRDPERAASSLARGEVHGNAVLTDQQVAQLRQRYAAGGMSQRELAREFGVSQPGVSALVTRRLRP